MPMTSDQIPIHHFTQDDEASIPFKLLRLEKRSDYDFTVAHRHNYFEIFAFEKGGGTHLIDFHEFEVKDHSFHFVSPGQVHLLKRAPGSNGFVLIFSRDFFNRIAPDSTLLQKHPLLHNRTANPTILPNRVVFSELWSCLLRMQTEVENSRKHKEALLHLYLNELLYKSADYLTDHLEQPNLIMRFNNLLEQHFYQWHLVKQYAEALNQTDKTLGTALKEHAGQSTQELINKRIVLEAKRLLSYSEMSIKEIGFSLGFEDPSHFGKFFKRNVGQTPSSFRAQN